VTDTPEASLTSHHDETSAVLMLFKTSFFGGPNNASSQFESTPGLQKPRVTFISRNEGERGLVRNL